MRENPTFNIVYTLTMSATVIQLPYSTHATDTVLCCISDVN